MTSGSVPLTLGAAQMRSLLDELDQRLRRRGVAASIYLVGGAALTLEYGRDGLTPDIDVVLGDDAVLEEARVIALERSLPEHWLSTSATGWVPPRPSWALRPPATAGLTVHVAPAEHLLAMKLIASRRKDRPDLALLIRECGMVAATAADYVDLLERVYVGEGLLAQMLGTPGGDDAAARREAVLLGEWAEQFAKSLGPSR